nr:MAG TPA: hypothetical protein [Caudoviricetes sp.]
MATNIKLTSGSVFNGNPITFDIMPVILKETPSFHRVIVEVKCGISGGNYETMRQFENVLTEGKSVQADVSSALSTFCKSYEYNAEELSFPLVKFRIKVYDEYMINGEVHPTEPIYYPTADGYLSTIFGGFSDMERMLSNGFKSVQRLSRKPSSSPQLACVGETLVTAVAYALPQDLLTSSDMAQPASLATLITDEGAQTVGGISIYAMPRSEAEHRMEIRFINSFGVMESVSVPTPQNVTLPLSATPYYISRQQTFSRMSRSVVRKEQGREKWRFVTDPLDEQWLRWYLEEFLLAQYAWIKIGGYWIPCTVMSEDEEVVFLDRTKEEMLTVTFFLELDVKGNPYAK